MDLSSSGTTFSVLFAICVLSYGQIYIEQNDDASYEQVNAFELEEENHRVSGDIFIVDKLTSDKENALQEFFENILEKENEVFVKITGNSLSIIKDVSELPSVLKFTDGHRFHISSIDNDILEVLQVAERKVHLYIITGENSEGPEVTGALIKQLKEREIRIDILRLQDEYGIPLYKDFGSRHRRQINFYQLLANVSGGSVINTNKANIGSALNLLKQSLKTSLVHVMRFADHSPAGKEFRIPVDDTMTQFIFRAQVERSNPVIIAMTPAGTPPPARPQLLGKASAGTVVGLLETNLTKPTDYGTWKITKLDFNLWDINVDGQSSLDFTHDFLEPGAGGYGEFPIKGRPIIGNTYKLSMNVPEYSKVQTVAMGMLFTREKLMPIDMKPLKNVGGRRGKSMFYESFTIPNKDFMVGIEGRDKSGHMFRRIDPILITPVGLKLVIPSLTGVKFYQNETLAIPFTVINQGSKEQDVDVKIEDDKKFAQTPTTLSQTIKPGQNFSGTFTIRAGLKVGETTTVTITAKPYLGHGLFSQGQFEIRRFTVLDKNITTTTLSTPTTSTTTTISTSTSTPTSTTSTSTVSSSTSQTTVSTTTKMSSTSSVTSSKTPQSTISAKQSTQKASGSTTTIPLSTGQTNTKSGSAMPSTSVSSSPKASAATAPVVGKSTATAATLKSHSTTTSSTSTKSPASSPIASASSSASTGTTMPHKVSNRLSTSSSTAAPQGGSKDSEKTGIPTTSVVVGVTTGAVVGIAAIGTMALLFRKAILKAGKGVEPSNNEQNKRRRQSNLAWT